MSKHTPGPWKIADDIPMTPLNVFVVVDDAHSWVARVGGDEVDGARANARLIAAAPDYYDAAAALIAAEDTEDVEAAMAAMRSLRAAHAKATGGKP